MNLNYLMLSRYELIIIIIYTAPEIYEMKSNLRKDATMPQYYRLDNMHIDLHIHTYTHPLTHYT